jgi:hypothetical protein
MELVVDNSGRSPRIDAEPTKEYHSHWLMDQLLQAQAIGDDRLARRLYVEIGRYLRLHSVEVF